MKTLDNRLNQTSDEMDLPGQTDEERIQELERNLEATQKRYDEKCKQLQTHMEETMVGNKVAKSREVDLQACNNYLTQENKLAVQRIAFLEGYIAALQESDAPKDMIVPNQQRSKIDYMYNAYNQGGPVMAESVKRW